MVPPPSTDDPMRVDGKRERRRRPFLGAALLGAASGMSVAALITAVIWFAPQQDRPRPSSVLRPTAVERIAIDDEERYVDGETSERVRYGTVNGWLIEGFRHGGPAPLTCLVASVPDRDESAPADVRRELVPACGPETGAGAIPLVIDLPTRLSDVGPGGTVEQVRVMFLDDQVQVFVTPRQASPRPR